MRRKPAQSNKIDIRKRQYILYKYSQTIYIKMRDDRHHHPRPYDRNKGTVGRTVRPTGDTMDKVSWTNVVGWIRRNPHATAPPPVALESTIECISIPVEEEGVWTQMAVEPSTPLSCVLSALDVNEYNASTVPIRRAFLRTTCTDLQVRAESELKGRAHPRAKTNEGLVEVTEKEASPWSAYGLVALAALYKIQMMVLNETDKTIKFIPEDATAWDRDVPIYYFAHNYRSIYVPPRGFGPETVSAWLGVKVADGWMIEAKEVKGTIDEIKALCEEHGVSLPAEKLKKDELVIRASRGLVYATFSKWTSTSISAA